MADDIRVSWAIGTTDVSALGAGLGRWVEEGTTAVAVSPHSLDGLLQDKILPRRPRGLRDLQTILLLLDDNVDRGVFIVNRLRGLATLTSLGGHRWLCCLL